MMLGRFAVLVMRHVTSCAIGLQARRKCLKIPCRAATACTSSPLMPECSTATPGMPGQDRKSTRLNSSHTVISYAVFCLKKKKNKQIRAFTRYTVTDTQHLQRSRV